MQLRKESLKKSGLPGFEPWPLRYRCSALTNWAIKPTESWSLNWFLIYPGKMKMKVWIYEIHIFELRNEEISVKKILAVINATYAVAKRKRSGFESRQAWFFQTFFSQVENLSASKYFCWSRNCDFSTVNMLFHSHRNLGLRDIYFILSLFLSLSFRSIFVLSLFRP